MSCGVGATARGSSLGTTKSPRRGASPPSACRRAGLPKPGEATSQRDPFGVPRLHDAVGPRVDHETRGTRRDGCRLEAATPPPDERAEPPCGPSGASPIVVAAPPKTSVIRRLPPGTLRDHKKTTTSSSLNIRTSSPSSSAPATTDAGNPVSNRLTSGSKLLVSNSRNGDASVPEHRAAAHRVRRGGSARAPSSHDPGSDRRDRGRVSERSTQALREHRPSRDELLDRDTRAARDFSEVFETACSCRPDAPDRHVERFAEIPVTERRIGRQQPQNQLAACRKPASPMPTAHTLARWRGVHRRLIRHPRRPRSMMM